MLATTGVWFLNTHVTIQLSHADNAGGLSMMLFRLTGGDGPPLHVHHKEDEVFHVIEGTVRFVVGGTTVVRQAGQTALGPIGVPHSFRVESDTARMLVVARGNFERVIRNLGRPAQFDGPPEPMVPTPEMQAMLAAQCALQQIDILGPPLS